MILKLFVCCACVCCYSFLYLIIFFFTMIYTDHANLLTTITQTTRWSKIFITTSFGNFQFFSKSLLTPGLRWSVQRSYVFAWSPEGSKYKTIIMRCHAWVGVCNVKIILTWKKRGEGKWDFFRIWGCSLLFMLCYFFESALYLDGKFICMAKVVCQQTCAGDHTP